MHKDVETLEPPEKESWELGRFRQPGRVVGWSGMRLLSAPGAIR